MHECKHSPDPTTGVPDSSKTAVMNATSRSNISSSTRSCLRYLLDGDCTKQRQPDPESFSRKTKQMCFVVRKLHAQGCRARGSTANRSTVILLFRKHKRYYVQLAPVLHHSHLRSQERVIRSASDDSLVKDWERGYIQLHVQFAYSVA